MQRHSKCNVRKRGAIYYPRANRDTNRDSMQDSDHEPEDEVDGSIIQGTFKNAVLTIWEPEERTPPWDALKKYIKYFAYGLEHSKKGRPHHQAYAQSWKAMRHSQWKELFPNIWIKKMLSDFRTNEGYCSKEGTYTEFGVKPELRGKSTVIANFKRKIDEGVRVEAIADESVENCTAYLRYRNGLLAFQNYKRQKNAENAEWRKPDVILLWGRARSGKTRYVRDKHGWSNITVISGDRLPRGFFPSYINDVVLFDDVEAGAIMPLSQFKNLTDGNSRQVDAKHIESVTWHPKTIYFTSNHHWTKWWPNLTPEDVRAVMERFTEVKKYE